MTSPSSIGWANIDRKIGVVAAAAAATSPAYRPAHRRATSAHTHTVTSPSTTWGRATDEVDMPNRSMLRACGTANPLSLSKVTVASGSNAPNTRACHEPDIDRAEAS